jgi:ubiquinone/menaquinone biosynthesis C-methylase UbiE
MSSFDAVAPQFDRYRALPEVAAKAVRACVLAQLKLRPRLLDLGAGSGRIGWPFVEAGDDYIGLDLSFGMLRAFAGRAASAKLAQADGSALPFAERTFDGVLLVQIFGGLNSWRTLIDEAIRVLQPGGALMLGRTRTPEGGIDARMKRKLAELQSDHDGPEETQNSRAKAETYLDELCSGQAEIEAAKWNVTRTPRAFLDRHSGGARFSKLPQGTREHGFRKISEWAVSQFGSLDARFTETHRFALRTFTFAER